MLSLFWPYTNLILTLYRPYTDLMLTLSWLTPTLYGPYTDLLWTLFKAYPDLILTLYRLYNDCKFILKRIFTKPNFWSLMLKTRLVCSYPPPPPRWSLVWLLSLISTVGHHKWAGKWRIWGNMENSREWKHRVKAWTHVYKDVPN